MSIKCKFQPHTMLALLLSMSFSAYADSVKITYIGSAGYLMEAGSQKVLIDAPFSDFVEKFEVPIASRVTQDKIASAKPPFDDVNLILTTHSHPGHFDVDVLVSFLRNSPKTKLISTPVVSAILNTTVSGSGSFKKQIVVPKLPTDYGIERIEVNGLDIRVSRAPHWSRPGTTDEGYIFNFALNLNGIEIVYALAQEKYVKTGDIEVLFSGSVESGLEPKHIVLTHQSKHEKIADLARETSSMPNITFLHGTLQAACMTKKENGEIQSVACNAD